MKQILQIVTIFFVALIAIVACNNKVEPKITVEDLTCDYQINPLGIDNTKPGFGWKIKADGLKDVQQTSFQILIASSEEKINKNKGDVWNSGMINSSQSVQIPYEGKPLVSRFRRVMHYGNL